MQFSEATNPSDIPMEAFNFDTVGVDVFAIDGEGGEKNNIRLTLYDGSIIKHWFWGNMAFDLRGMKLAKSRIPILYAHDRDKRVAYSTKAIFDDKFTLEGKMLKNSEQAQSIKSDYQDGFPFEASLRFDENDVTLRYIKEGETVKVNGKLLKGPGTVLLKTKIKEASVCVFGVAKNCKTTIFRESSATKASSVKQKNNTDFWEHVEQRIKLLMKGDTTLTEVSARAKAVRFCVAKYPELHKRSLNELRIKQ